MVSTTPARVASILAPLRVLRPEVVLAIDDQLDKSFDADFRRLGDRVVRAPYLGSVSRAFGWLLSQCTGDWVFRIDDDEVPSAGLAAELEECICGDPPITHAWVPRRWLYPNSASVLAQWPWRPDYQLRLNRNDPALVSFPGRIHEVLAVLGPGLYLREPIYHADLLFKSFEERLRKVRGYEAIRPGMTVGGVPLNAAYYLPERQEDLPTESVPAADASPVRSVFEHDPPTSGRWRRRGALARVEPAAIDAHWERRELGPDAYRVRLEPSEHDFAMTAGQARTVDVEVHNVGSEVWPGGPDRRPQIRVGYRWRDAEGAIAVADGSHTPIPSELRPGRSAMVPALVIAPPIPGPYVLELDLVEEGVRWFGGEHVVRVDVRPARRSGGSALD
jgi:hypothetical protein